MGSDLQIAIAKHSAGERTDFPTHHLYFTSFRGGEESLRDATHPFEGKIKKLIIRKFVNLAATLLICYLLYSVKDFWAGGENLFMGSSISETSKMRPKR